MSEERPEYCEKCGAPEVWCQCYVCPTCARLEDAIRFMAQRDYRRKMELWREYEQHRREAHHVLHVATAR